ncbi:MAG: pseudaminic acid cytidylyltransferase [Lachnospiraceae bacterium]|nr:pseudaminic acid cytidylyltransferase [Lachnospiraceae bacterium]
MIKDFTEDSIAIITARGGSRRIPGKNIKDFLGKPIIAYSIEAALNSGIFKTVMVSTDSAEIRSVAEKYGAEVPFLRSPATSGDFATTADVLHEVISEYKNTGVKFRYACCLYPTAPFVTPEKLKKAMDIMLSGNFDCVLPVTPFSFPVFRGMSVKDGRAFYRWPEFSMRRSQDLETLYHDCGQFYMFRVKRFMETGELIDDNTGAMPVPETEVQDIDYDTDWDIAEMKYTLMKKRQSEKDQNP